MQLHVTLPCTPLISPPLPIRLVLLTIWMLLMTCCVLTNAPAQEFAASFYEDPIALDPHELAGFNRVLHTSALQQAAAQSLLDAANAELKQQEARQHKIGEAYSAIPREKRTAADREKLLRDSKAAEPDIPAARRKLILDLRALLDPPQDADWPRFERFLRRARWQIERWSIERVNLLALVERLHLDAATRATLTETLDHYERELDALLILCPQQQADSRAEEQAISAQHPTDRFSPDIPRPAGKAVTATWHRLMQLNDTYARRIATLLPESSRAAWTKNYDQASLPEAYGTLWHHVDVTLRAAPDLPNLSDDTRTALRRIIAEYAPQYDALSDKVADMERRERAASPDERLDMSDWDPTRLRRGEIQSQTSDRIKALITPAQFDKMIHTWSDQDQAWDNSMIY